MTSEGPPAHRKTNLARASVWMALGTVVSRFTGMLRALLLLAVLGYSLNADIFNVANSIPNSLYILVAGGIFNVILVPQLVRAMKTEPDGGEAFANRIITGALLVLGVATVALMIAVPLIMRLFFNASFFTDEFETQRQSAYWLMVLCMPQVFFYGMFVLIGQLLNSRERFGPMMWAPIVNNLIAIAALASYAWIFGVSDSGDGFTTNQVFLLGLGSTAGIVIQALTLLPFLKQIGFRFRPRFDFRGVGLRHTVKLGLWTLAFIIVNQISYFLIIRLGVNATTEGQRIGEPAAGQTVYEIGFLISQVPHGVITVSLATAMMPTLAALAADRQFTSIGMHLGRTIRIVLALIAPLAVLVAVQSQSLAVVLGGWGSATDTFPLGTTFAAFSLAMVSFTVHYVVLRGFYAMEDTRTPFFIQVVIALINVSAAFALTTFAPLIYASTMLALSFGIAYSVGVLVSTVVLSRRVGSILTREMLRFLVRLVATCVIAAITLVAVLLAWDALNWPKDSVASAISYLAVSSTLAGLSFLVTAKLFGLNEINYLANKVLRRN